MICQRPSRDNPYQRCGEADIASGFFDISPFQPGQWQQVIDEAAPDEAGHLDAHVSHEKWAQRDTGIHENGGPPQRSPGW